MKYYLLAIYKGEPDCFVIGLNARTIEEARSGLAWQKQGFCDSDYCIAERTGKTTFKKIDSSITYETGQGCYTDAAWNEFLSEWSEVTQ